MSEGDQAYPERPSPDWPDDLKPGHERATLASLKPRMLLGLAWVLALLVAFFKSAQYAADQLGYDLNEEAFAGMLGASLAFVGLAAAVVKLFRWITD